MHVTPILAVRADRGLDPRRIGSCWTPESRMPLSSDLTGTRSLFVLSEILRAGTAKPQCALPTLALSQVDDSTERRAKCQYCNYLHLCFLPCRLRPRIVSARTDKVTFFNAIGMPAILTTCRVHRRPTPDPPYTNRGLHAEVPHSQRPEPSMAVPQATALAVVSNFDRLSGC